MITILGIDLTLPELSHFTATAIVLRLQPTGLAFQEEIHLLFDSGNRLVFLVYITEHVSGQAGYQKSEEARQCGDQYQQRTAVADGCRGRIGCHLVDGNDQTTRNGSADAAVDLDASQDRGPFAAQFEVEVVVDRVIIRARQRSRIADSVETSLELGHGVMRTALAAFHAAYFGSGYGHN